MSFGPGTFLVVSPLHVALCEADDVTGLCQQAVASISYVASASMISLEAGIECVEFIGKSRVSARSHSGFSFKVCDSAYPVPQSSPVTLVKVTLNILDVMFF